MELKIFNRDLNLVGIIDSFSSLIWNRKYNLLGDFQLNILFTSEHNSLLKIDNIIYKDNGECGFITSKEIKIDDDGTESIEVKGKFILGYLERRIIWEQEEINSSVVDASYMLVHDNCINCSEQRKIPNLMLGEKINIEIPLVKQVSYNNLLDTVCLISQTHELGLKVNFDIIEKKLVFKIYKGIDRSINQSKVAPVIFSRDFENVLNQNYVESNNNYKNVALVAGAGEGIERKTLAIGDKSGLDRYELFVDARDICDKRYVSDDEGVSKDEPIPENEYSNLLESRGNEKLTQYYKIKSFDSTINTNSNVVYKEDYNLGDIVTFFDKKWGLTIDTRITEISEIYDIEGLTINITFGNNIPTLMDIIKRK
ncbi:siphovirus ReqiPepy6 Gp37-like family protein [Clostridium botulinum]|uniref:siphovirus ReqiPepy6 Gp37-like family protein n=1 Tax=Clostridium botulinum TaxID=1491 RepID=UPI0006C06970|nr:siphovirus ReqiPepy6 Gp37-like family protein [Clostridium botulinum]KAI3350154.1 siphovirus ReqiPepy6 Gp37-like family protein [Clostridium botulinum]KOM88968.1 hypothetical protein ACP51_04340 [Clostridium botulinum]KOR63534.1 hypothetical protein ADT22_03125 [Clostridium botulinum]MCS6111550.1 hypothetical protein [Clostridium botulinum]NFE10970.1 hypothetical protein [Clostridium botulinum]